MRRKTRGGFTLVEVMVASAVLVLVVTGFATGYIMARRSSVMAGDYMRAMHAARQGIETLSGCAYADSKLNYGTRSLSGLGISNTYTVAANPSFPTTTKDVEFRVFWTTPGASKTLSVSYCCSFTRGLHPE